MNNFTWTLVTNLSSAMVDDGIPSSSHLRVIRTIITTTTFRAAAILANMNPEHELEHEPASATNGIVVGRNRHHICNIDLFVNTLGPRTAVFPNGGVAKQAPLVVILTKSE